MMSCYSVSSCIKNSASEEKKYITDILFIFPQISNVHKVAMDASYKILDIYASIAATNGDFAYWLSLMTMTPSSFETINVDINGIDCQEEIFLKLTSKINGDKKLLVHSHQGWQNFQYVKNNVIAYDGVDISIFDRDEAIEELNPPTPHITNSVVAMGGATITDVKLTIND